MSILQKSTIKADGEMLACEYKLSNENVIILHGGGEANKRRYYSLAEEIMKRGRGVILFDFSGHGESSGTVAELSLSRRIKQARTVIDTLVPTGNIYLAGFSMSGQTVCDLLPVYGNRIKGILLGCAAVYRPDIFDIPFGSDEFTTRLRQGGWQNTPSRENLADYRGRTILAIGSQDAVIPKGVTQLLEEAASDRVYIEYSGAGHLLAAWLGEHPKEQRELVEAFLG